MMGQLRGTDRTDAPIASTSAPLCSIIIRAFNEERHIANLLAGIRQQTLREAEVVLVDSGSTDRTLAIASRYPVKVAPIAPDQFTFGRSLNWGCAQAKGKYLVIVSSHAYPVYPDWLERLLSPFSDPSVALVYGKQRGAEQTRFSEAQVFARWFPPHSNASQNHPFCNNANAAIPRELWMRHPYDEDLPGLEDLDWAAWALSQGFHIAYSAEAEVVHVHEESMAAIYNRYRREGMALKTIRPHESFRLGDFLQLTASNMLCDLWHARLARVLAREWPAILGFRLMQFWGTYQGFRHAGPLTSQLKRTFYYPRGFRSAGGPPDRSLHLIDCESNLPTATPSGGAPQRERVGGKPS